MRWTRFAALAALALSFGAPPAGCGGGGGSDTFRRDYNSAVEKLSKVNSNIGRTTGGSGKQSNAKIAQEFERIADTTQRTSSTLSELNPPKKARDEFDTLLSVMRKGTRALRDAANAAKQSNPDAFAKATRKLSQSSREINTAEDALKKAVDG